MAFRLPRLLNPNDRSSQFYKKLRIVATVTGSLFLCFGGAALALPWWLPRTEVPFFDILITVYCIIAGLFFLIAALKVFSLVYRGRLSAFVNRIGLFAALLAGSAVALGLGISTYVLLAGVLPLGTQEVAPADLTKISLAVVAGLGGVVALVVAYRRQASAERARFVEGFGAAAKQLGDPDSAVRIAGVYAMAGVADDASDHKRQQCIDVLCGYLRLPYSKEAGANHQRELVVKFPAKRGGQVAEHRYQYRLDDKQVRQTIVRVIRSRLQYEAVVGWWNCDFDFAGACFEDASFAYSLFRGFADFSGTEFFGSEASFFEAEFLSSVSFEGASFKTDSIWKSAVFAGPRTSFCDTKFEGSKTSFADSIFGWVESKKGVFASPARKLTREVRFHGAQFASLQTDFTGVTFACEVSYCRADFSVGLVSFEGAKRWDPAPEFDWSQKNVKELPLKPHNVVPKLWPAEGQQVSDAGSNPAAHGKHVTSNL